MNDDSFRTKFRIKHEKVSIKIVITIGILACMITVPLGNVPLMIAALSATILFTILYFIDKFAGATITVDDNTVKISQLFSTKTIAISDIEHMLTEDYYSRRKQRRIYRLKMTMYYRPGKKLVLTDDASQLNGIFGFVTGIREQRPSVEIPLYQAYELIQEKMQQKRTA